MLLPLLCDFFLLYWSFFPTYGAYSPLPHSLPLSHLPSSLPPPHRRLGWILASCNFSIPFSLISMGAIVCVIFAAMCPVGDLPPWTSLTVGMHSPCLVAPSCVYYMFFSLQSSLPFLPFSFSHPFSALSLGPRARREASQSPPSESVRPFYVDEHFHSSTPSVENPLIKHPWL